MRKKRVTTPRKPDQVLTFSFVWGNSMHSQKVDNILWIDLVSHFSIDLSEYFTLIEIARVDKSLPLILQLHLWAFTSSWE